jgi:DNA-directed RNA polymerase subunit L
MPIRYNDPKIKLKGNDDLLNIELSGVDISIANALRRILMAEVPCYAFDESEIMIPPAHFLVDTGIRGGITENNTIYHNNILAQRIAFLPIMPNEKIKKPSTYVFTISDKEDPNKPLINESDKIKFVYFKDIRVWKIVSESEHKSINIKNFMYDENYGDMPVLTLKKGEKVRVAMRLKKGISSNKRPTKPHYGYNNSCWLSSIVIYKFESTYDRQQKKGDHDHETLDQKRDFPKDDYANPNKVLISIENTGHLLPINVLKGAIKILKDKVKNFQDKLSKKELDIQTTTIPHLVSIKVDNEDYTLGNLIGNHFLYYVIELASEKNKDKAIQTTLGACMRPHPLDNFIKINLKTPSADIITVEYKGSKEPSINAALSVSEILVNTCEKLSKKIENL